MKKAALLALAILGASSPGLASADDTAVCLAAVASGQDLRDAHKLLAARDKFRACAAASCPEVLRHDCTAWVRDADAAIPTVVFAAKDGAGNDAFDVRVSVDGALVVTKLEGAAVPVDPGPHTFRFEWPGRATVERQVLVLEGQRALPVSAALPVTTPPPGSTPLRLVTPAPVPAPPSSGPSVRSLGFAAGGIGLVAVAVGGVLGGLTLSEVSTAKGECGAVGCGATTSSAAVHDMQTAGTYADASTGLFIVGGALVAAGVVMVVVGRGGGAVQVAPTTTGNGGGLMIRGTW